MIQWWVCLILCVGCAFLGMMLMALVVSNGRDDPRE